VPQASTETLLLICAVLLLLSVLATKLGGRVGVPGLLLFLGIGMLAGSDGPGGIWFDNYGLAQFVGTLALVFILYTGGLQTHWPTVRPILGAGLSLATLGVLLTMLFTGAFAYWLLEFSWLEALLLGAVVSSTDASAVFSVLREQKVRLRGWIRPLLEFESGTNDPMAVFLTIGLTGLITQPQLSGWSIIPLFIQQMALGLLLGYGLGRGAVWLFRHLRLSFDGLYAVLSITVMLLVFALTAVLGGSGFLAVYVAGMVLGNSQFEQKQAIISFQEGITWLMEIGMFLTLGLLVFPLQLVTVAAPAISIALFLMLVARPLSVFMSLPISTIAVREKAFVSWVGLRGAVPIVLATFPLLAGVNAAQQIFNVTFFVVLISVLVQGTTLSWAARLLGVEAEKRW
jgi:potassium/hydrogen antiporter